MALVITLGNGSSGNRVALLYVGWRSSDQDRLDARVIYSGSSGHALDGSRDRMGGGRSSTLGCVQLITFGSAVGQYTVALQTHE